MRSPSPRAVGGRKKAPLRVSSSSFAALRRDAAATAVVLARRRVIATTANAPASHGNGALLRHLIRITKAVRMPTSARSSISWRGLLKDDRGKQPRWQAWNGRRAWRKRRYVA